MKQEKHVFHLSVRLFGGGGVAGVSENSFSKRVFKKGEGKKNPKQPKKWNYNQM